MWFCPFTYIDNIAIFRCCHPSSGTSMMQRRRLPLAIPQFIYNTEPTLVPGGGAEIIPLANPSWFANNGCSPSFSCVSSQNPGLALIVFFLHVDLFSHSQTIGSITKSTTTSTRKIGLHPLVSNSFPLHYHYHHQILLVQSLISLFF